MGLTDKHLYYGDDIPKTTTEKDYFRYIEQLKKEKADLLSVIKNIKVEIQAKYDSIPYGHTFSDDGWIEALEWVLESVIDKHISPTGAERSDKS